LSLIGLNQGISRAFLLIPLIFTSCAPGSVGNGLPFSADLLPPELQSALTPDEQTIRFVFDEPVNPGKEEITLQPPLPIETVEAVENILTVVFGTDQIIGESYTARISVTDNSGNSLSFLYRFTGWNPRVPEILINEFNPRGSGKTPDCIELYTLKGGNLGGLCLRIGTASRYSEEIIFPAIEIPDGEYILVHAKAEGIAEEIDEIESLNASGGLLASDNARDFWISGAPGLPGNNGAISLFARRGGEVIDGVLWSDRSDNSEDEKLGWTSEGYIFATDMAESGAWKTGTGKIPYPSEAVNVSVSTATRSLSRGSLPRDTNLADDWHTVPTRGQTFGSINTDEVYEP